jgi:hypothetical protein
MSSSDPYAVTSLPLPLYKVPGGAEKFDRGSGSGSFPVAQSGSRIVECGVYAPYLNGE